MQNNMFRKYNIPKGSTSRRGNVLLFIGFFD